ncbi:YceI family protein [Lichenihabitans sp. PAMC28606]|uniref:YceI family protein n=1 Tax=Lichenihabitans sp. PAMC28606 TaxID=2880932 RepID=UPI001D09D21F|nr:YceI family protein [Lichenihabitans sp. PAMC28606]UDL96640.1 YceI family protein [Lichenihabitans sp. PAMC28606]
MFRTVSALSLVALLSVPALAQTKVEPAKVEAGKYNVDPNHTQVLFGVNHMGFTTYYGSFTDAAGTLDLDPAKPDASKLDVTIKTASVSVPSPKLLDELKGDQWLDATKFPDTSFKSTKVTKTGATTANVTGDLTLHGVTKPVTLAVTYVNAGTNPLSKSYTAGFEAKGKIKRSDFGVKTYVPLIGDDVDLIISGSFEHAK